MVDVPQGPHRWVGAATVTLSRAQASHAARRLSVRVPAEQQVDVLEVYCATCRRVFADGVEEACVISHHLRGGPIGERKKRGKAEDAESADADA